MVVERGAYTENNTECEAATLGATAGGDPGPRLPRISAPRQKRDRALPARMRHVWVVGEAAHQALGESF